MRRVADTALNGVIHGFLIVEMVANCNTRSTDSNTVCRKIRYFTLIEAIVVKTMFIFYF